MINRINKDSHHLFTLSVSLRSPPEDACERSAPRAQCPPTGQPARGCRDDLTMPQSITESPLYRVISRKPEKQRTATVLLVRR